MDWFIFAINVLTLAVQGCLQLSFACSFTDRRAKRWYFIVYFTLIYLSNLAAVRLHSDGLAIGMVVFILYGMNRTLLKNSRPVSCVASILAVYVGQLSFGLVNSIEVLMFPHFTGRIVFTYILVTAATFLALLLCRCIYWLITKQFSLQNNRREPYLWMLVPQGLFFFAAEFYILNINYGNVVTVPYPMEISKHLSLLGLQLLGLGALLCSLYAYRRICDGFFAQAAMASLTQEIHAQKTYVAQAKMRYEQTQSFRHDIKNHLVVLNGLMKNENGERADSYFKKLEAVADGLSFPIYTGNPVVDILLSDKLEFMKANGIKTDISLTLPGPCEVDDYDWCVIFSNALDNAVFACTQTDGKKFIQVTGEQQGDFYMLEFINSCQPQSSFTIGRGLSNVETVSKKYQGAMTAEILPSQFRLNVLLNISIQ